MRGGNLRRGLSVFQICPVGFPALSARLAYLANNLPAVKKTILKAQNQRKVCLRIFSYIFLSDFDTAL